MEIMGPISSYGDLYFSNQNHTTKSHKDQGFIEPIYSYVPSIGISNIKVPKIYEYWKNNYLIASMEIARIDEKFTKILFSEKIYVGEKIRDIKFYDL